MANTLASLNLEDGRQPDLNSYIQNMIDLRLEHTFDTLVIAAGAGPQRAAPFSAPISASKSATATNMREPNKFPAPECLVLDYLGFYITPDTILSDIALLMANYRFEFKINRKIMWDGLFWMYPPGYGVTGASTKNNESSWMIGPANPAQTIRFGNYGRFIGPNQLFTLDIICDGAVPTFVSQVTLIPFLHGIKGVAVQ
jgi:hypothetical protein